MSLQDSSGSIWSAPTANRCQFETNQLPHSRNNRSAAAQRNGAIKEMKSKIIAFAAAAALAFGAVGPAEAQSQTVQVQFQPGTTGAAYAGRLGSGEAIRYVLNAREGQFMSVSVLTAAPFTNYILYAPDGSIMHESTQAGFAYYGQLWQSGDHAVEVFYNGDAGTFANFDVAFAISALVGAPPAPDMAGVNERACLDAVSGQTGNTVTVLRTEFSEANTLVMIGVGPQLAPWRCLVSGGIVAEVMFAGDEGAM